MIQGNAHHHIGRFKMFFFFAQIEALRNRNNLMRLMQQAFNTWPKVGSIVTMKDNFQNGFHTALTGDQYIEQISQP